jgi:intracellular sulfur oxidation DsrE/DsrF family protein
MTSTPIKLFAATSALWLSACAMTPAPQGSVAPDKVVYHINDSGDARGALRNIGNHLEVNPSAQIVVVSHSQGVDFLMEGAKDKNGNPYNITVEELKGKGVTFDVCEITLKRRNLDKSKFIPEAKFVPSGVAELAKLQQREGYAYIKP